MQGSDLVLFLFYKSYDAYLSTLDSSCANAESFRQTSSLCWRRDMTTNSRLSRLLRCGGNGPKCWLCWATRAKSLVLQLLPSVRHRDTKRGSPAVYQNIFFSGTSVESRKEVCPHLTNCWGIWLSGLKNATKHEASLALCVAAALSLLLTKSPKGTTPDRLFYDFFITPKMLHNKGLHPFVFWILTTIKMWNTKWKLLV